MYKNIYIYISIYLYIYTHLYIYIYFYKAPGLGPESAQRPRCSDEKRSSGPSPGTPKGKRGPRKNNKPTLCYARIPPGR